ncbi:MAG TPA: hypothetical protein ENK43_17075 [Planctomycetes bacterium]|nr:hypothetical protein [Planctomycetota bacterium]
MIDSELSSKLSAYLDGELSEEDSRNVEEILRNNAQARAAFEDLRRTSAAMRGFYDVENDLDEASSSREAEVVERISRASARVVAVRSHRGRRMFLWVGGFLLLATLLVWGLRRLERSRSVGEMLRGVLELMESDHYELSSRTAGESELWQVGPRGRFHLRRVGGAGILHEGFDGRRTWRYVEGDRKVILLSGEAARVVREENPWKRLEAALWAAVDEEGNGETWIAESESGGERETIVLRGPSGKRIELSFDAEGGPAAVTLDGVAYVVTRRPALGDEAFTWETWAPGIPVEEAAR